MTKKDQDNIKGLLDDAREATHPEASDTQIVAFLAICTHTLAKREGKTLFDLWCDVYKAADEAGANG